VILLVDLEVARLSVRVPSGGCFELPRHAPFQLIVPARVEPLSVLVDEPDVVLLGEVVLTRCPVDVCSMARHRSTRSRASRASYISTPRHLSTSTHGSPRSPRERAVGYGLRRYIKTSGSGRGPHADRGGRPTLLYERGRVEPPQIDGDRPPVHTEVYE